MSAVPNGPLVTVDAIEITLRHLLPRPAVIVNTKQNTVDDMGDEVEETFRSMAECKKERDQVWKKWLRFEKGQMPPYAPGNTGSVKYCKWRKRKEMLKGWLKDLNKELEFHIVEKLKRSARKNKQKKEPSPTITRSGAKHGKVEKEKKVKKGTNVVKRSTSK